MKGNKVLTEMYFKKCYECLVKNALTQGFIDIFVAVTTALEHGEHENL